MQDVRGQEEAGNLEGDGRLAEGQRVAQDLHHLARCSARGAGAGRGASGNEQAGREGGPTHQDIQAAAHRMDGCSREGRDVGVTQASHALASRVRRRCCGSCSHASMPGPREQPGPHTHPTLHCPGQRPWRRRCRRALLSGAAASPQTCRAAGAGGWGAQPAAVSGRGWTERRCFVLQQDFRK